MAVAAHQHRTAYQQANLDPDNDQHGGLTEAVTLCVPDSEREQERAGPDHRKA